MEEETYEGPVNPYLFT